MSSRRRRAARRARKHDDVHAPPGPFNPANALLRWKAKLGALTARGFTTPPFAGLVFGPIVRVDLDRDDPVAELHDATTALFVRLASVGRPS